MPPYRDQNYGFSDRATNESVRRRRAADLADVRDINRVITNYVNFSMRQFMLGAADRVDASIRTEVQLFAELTRGTITRNYESRIKTVHREVGQHAIDKIVAAYNTRSGQRKSGSYRTDDSGPGGRSYRDSGKVLLKALQDPRMFRVARDGIDFLDPAFLDSRARQWYRLNFGAGAAGGRTRKGSTARMTMFGKRVGGDISLNRFGPSRPFTMPAGFWVDGTAGRLMKWTKNAKKDHFYMAPPPWGRSGYATRALAKAQDTERVVQEVYRNRHRSIHYDKKKHYQQDTLSEQGLRSFIRTRGTWTKGIRGSRFLDEGVYQLAKELPLAYAQLYKEWFNTYSTSGKGPVSSRRIQERFSAANIISAGRLAEKEFARIEGQRRLRSSTGAHRNRPYTRRYS